MRLLGITVLASGLFSLVGCTTDADGDGLTDAEEKELGTSPDSSDSDGDGFADSDEIDFGSDPLAADADADGLQDADEAAAGTDPNSADSDGDGYPDGAEVETGHSPTDAADMIYVGGWPYNPNKDDMAETDWSGKAKEGAAFPHFVSYDQYGDTFDSYDFAFQGVPVIVDISAEWCSYCQELAKFMADKRSYFDDYTSSYPALEGVREGLKNGTVLWIEVLDQNDQGGLIEQGDLEQWEKKYPNEKVPVVADEEQNFLAWTKLAGYPTLLVLNEDFTVGSYNKNDYFEALAWADENQ